MIIGIMLVVIVGCASKEKKQGFSDFITINNGEVVSAYENGVDVTEKRKELVEQVKENVAEELGVKQSELEFKDFCMLEDDGITVEVKYDGEWIGYMYEIDKNKEIK